MNQLSNYIHTQLNALRREVQRTPPKKHSSLAKIQALVHSAPLSKADKKKIKSEIKEVQSAIKIARTPKKIIRQSPQKIATPTINSVIKLSEEYEAVQNLLKTKLRNGLDGKDKVEKLRKEYEEVRALREKKEKYLKQLIFKVQRLERREKSLAKSVEKKKQETLLNRQYEQKKRQLKNVKKNAMEAAKSGHKEVLKELMQAYCHVIDKKV